MSLDRSAEHESLVTQARQYFPGASNGNAALSGEHSFVIAGGQGAYVHDPDGRRWIDYLLGSGPMIVGHAHPDVNAAVRDQLDKGSTFFNLNDKSIELAGEIIDAVACADQLRFTSTGSEATFFALRVARAFRGRDKILKFEGGFHGSHDYAVMSTEGQAASRGPYGVRGSSGIPECLEKEVLIAPFNNLERAAAIIESHHDELGAVIIEPFQRALSPMPGFLQGLRDATAQYGVPLIFDEVVTGFRFAYGGAQEHYGVVPDLAALGKIIGGGYPLAAVVGRSEIMSCFSQPDSRGVSVAQVGTLNGNPIAAAAGLATLEILRRPGSYERLQEVGQRLREQLQATLREHEVPGQVLGEGPVFHLVFTEQPVQNYRDMLTGDAEKNRVFHEALMANGVLKPSAKGYASLAHSDEDLADTARAFDTAMSQVAQLS